MASDQRYDGKPLLRLLELYVLRAIGQLSQEEEAVLEKMAPKLHSIYGGDGDWHEAVAAAVHMPDDMPITVQGMWNRDLEIAQSKGMTLSPQIFAESFVDEHLVN